MGSKQTLQEAAHKFRRAFEAGQRDKGMGLERLSAYMDNWESWWYYAGWDGKTLNQAWGEFAAENERGTALLKAGKPVKKAARIH